MVYALQEGEGPGWGGRISSNSMNPITLSPSRSTPGHFLGLLATTTGVSGGLHGAVQWGAEPRGCVAGPIPDVCGRIERWRVLLALSPAVRCRMDRAQGSIAGECGRGVRGA